MANPQPENGFVKLANEIWNEIIRRDFSKRQKDIILFIWRLSYGCRKKTAYVPMLKDFELCGVGASNITKELKYLVDCKVITWDKLKNLFAVTKDYEQWQISPVRGWDEGKFKELLHENLIQITYQNDKSEPKKAAPKITITYQNNKSRLIKTISDHLLKREVRLPSNPCRCRVKRVSKDSIKNSIKDIKYSSSGEADPFTLFQNHKFGVLDSTTREMIQEVIEDSAESWVVEAMKEAIKLNKISWRYVETILKRWSGIPHTEPWTIEREPQTRNRYSSSQPAIVGSVPKSKQELKNENTLKKIREAKERERERGTGAFPDHRKLL